MNRKFLIISSFLLFNAIMTYAGGAWTQNKGSAFIKIGQWWVIADKHYNAEGTTVSNNRAGVLNTSLYVEYGITDRFEAILNLPIVSHAFQDVTPNYRQTITSMGDTDLGIKYAILKDKTIRLSTYAMFGIPFGVSDGGFENELQTGSGEFSQMVGLVSSASGKITDHINLYGSLGLDINHRGGSFSDEWRLLADVGAVFYDKVILSYKLTNLKSFENGEKNNENPIGGVFSNNRAYLSYTYEIGVNLNEQIGLAGSYGSVYSAKNIFANPAYSLSIYYRI